MKALEIATGDQRITLGISYDRGYSNASRSIHSNIGDPLSEVTRKTIDAQIGRIGLLSAHVVVCGFQLLGVEPTGLAAQLKSTLNGTEAATKLHSGMCTEFKVGDVVMAYGSYLSIVTDISKSKYGYTACKVRFLTEPLLKELPEDWFPAPYIRVLSPKAKLLPLLKAQLEKHGGAKIAESLLDVEFVNLIASSIQEMNREGILEKVFSTSGKNSKDEMDGN